MQRSQLDSIQKYNYSDSDSLIKTLFFNSDSLPARLNPHYEPWSYKKKKHKKIAYKKYVWKETKVKRCQLILDFKPQRS